MIESYKKLFEELLEIKSHIHYDSRETRIEVLKKSWAYKESLKEKKTQVLAFESNIYFENRFEDFFAIIEYLQAIDDFLAVERSVQLTKKMFRRKRYLQTQYEERMYNTMILVSKKEQLPRKKERREKIIEQNIITHFDVGKKYMPLAFNAQLAYLGFDPASTRRELVSMGYVGRELGGKEYWRIK